MTGEVSLMRGVRLQPDRRTGPSNLRIILHADDFGLTPGINRAIIELHTAGMLRSTSLMSTAAYAEEAAALARTHPGLGVGCHLTFADGVPAADPHRIPSLLGRDGRFLPTVWQFTAALLRNQIRRTELREEAIAQIQRLQGMGVAVTHVDTHKHLHTFSRVAGAVLRAAAACGVRAVRNPAEPAWSARLSGAPLLRRFGIWAMRQSDLPQRARRRGLQTTAGTLGIAATGTLNETVLRQTRQAAIQHGQDATWELCCHPGYLDEPLRQSRTRLLRSRETELRALLNVVPEFLTSNGSSPGAVTLIHYVELAPEQGRQTRGGGATR